MDKLIKDIEKILSENFFTGDMSFLSDIEQGYKIGSSDVAHHLSSSLNRYRVRQQRKAKSYAKEISSHQWHQINLLVDCARDRWRALGSVSNFYDDAYCRGYINAVLRMMDILGIDEKRVKE